VQGMCKGHCVHVHGRLKGGRGAWGKRRAARGTRRAAREARSAVGAARGAGGSGSKMSMRAKRAVGCAHFPKGTSELRTALELQRVAPALECKTHATRKRKFGNKSKLRMPKSQVQQGAHRPPR
jgi:hypothetical protein